MDMDDPATSSSNSSGPTTRESGLNVETGLGPTAPDYAEIIVVRHGETSYNAEKIIQGQIDVEMNETGRLQASAVAAHLSQEPKISAVYSSDLKCALETARIIASSCDAPEIVQDPELRERNLGALQGLLFRLAPDLQPYAHAVAKSSRGDEEIPGGGESFDQLYNRCTAALQKIAMNHIGERVVVATHVGVVWALHKRANPRGRLHQKILNGSMSIFHISADKWTVQTWNEILF